MTLLFPFSSSRISRDRNRRESGLRSRPESLPGKQKLTPSCARIASAPWYFRVSFYHLIVSYSDNRTMICWKGVIFRFSFFFLGEGGHLQANIHQDEHPYCPARPPMDRGEQARVLRWILSALVGRTLDPREADPPEEHDSQCDNGEQSEDLVPGAELLGL